MIRTRSMADDHQTEMLTHRNRALLALAATARADAREAFARAADNVAISRRSQLVLARALFRLQHRRADSSPSADAVQLLSGSNRPAGGPVVGRNVLGGTDGRSG